MTEDEARKRYILLNVVRFTGVAMVFAGAANASGKLLPDLAPVLGYVLVVMGALDFFAVPVLLKNAWRSSDQ